MEPQDRGKVIAFNIILLVLVIIFGFRRNQGPYGRSDPEEDFSFLVLVVLYISSLIYLIFLRFNELSKTDGVIPRPPPAYPAVAMPIIPGDPRHIVGICPGINGENNFPHQENYFSLPAPIPNISSVPVLCNMENKLKLKLKLRESSLQPPSYEEATRSRNDSFQSQKPNSEPS